MNSFGSFAKEQQPLVANGLLALLTKPRAPAHITAGLAWSRLILLLFPPVQLDVSPDTPRSGLRKNQAS